jgi:hypothetical protein
VKRHSTDMISMFFGLIFAAVAAWWIFGTTADFGQTAGWLVIGLLVVFGLVGLVSAAARRANPVETGVAAPEAVARPAEPGADPFTTAPATATEAAGQETDTMVMTDPDDTAVLAGHDDGDTSPMPRWGDSTDEGKK